MTDAASELPPEQPGGSAPADDPDVLTAYGANPELREAMAEALRVALFTAGPDFGRAAQEMNAAVAGVDPIALMGAIAMYFGTSEAGTNPEFTRRDGMFWHHIELTQAFALRQPLADPSKQLAETIPTIPGAARTLSHAWMILEAKKIDRAKDDQRERAMAVMKLRIHAHAVRGWGYAERLVPMLEDLLRPLDAEAEQRIGIRLSALLGWWIAIGDRLNERLDVGPLPGDVLTG